MQTGTKGREMQTGTKIKKLGVIDINGQDVLEVTLSENITVMHKRLQLDRNAMAELELAFADWRRFSNGLKAKS